MGKWPEWKVWGWVCAQIAACWLVGGSTIFLWAVAEGKVDWRAVPILIVPMLACTLATFRLPFPLPPAPEEGE